MSKNKLRPLGDITTDLEPLILEMVCEHKLQAHELLGMIYLYLQVHCPSSIEVYDADGSSPVLFYGPVKTKIE